MYLQWVFKLLHTVAEICVSHHLKNFVLGTFCQIIFTFFRHMLPFTNTLTLASSLKSEHFHWVSCSEDSYALDYSKLQHNSISPNLSVGTFCLNTVELLCVTTFCSAWAHRRTSQANTCVRRSAPISIVDRTGNVMYTCTLVGLCVNGHLRVANCVFAIIQ